MSLTACLIREGVKDTEDGRPLADCEPSRGGWLSLHDFKASQEKVLYLFLFLFPVLCFQTNKQHYFDPDVPPVVCLRRHHHTPRCTLNY